MVNIQGNFHRFKIEKLLTTFAIYCRLIITIIMEADSVNGTRAFNFGLVPDTETVMSKPAKSRRFTSLLLEVLKHRFNKHLLG